MIRVYIDRSSSSFLSQEIGRSNFFTLVYPEIGWSNFLKKSFWFTHLESFSFNIDTFIDRDPVGLVRLQNFIRLLLLLLRPSTSWGAWRSRKLIDSSFGAVWGQIWFWISA